MIPQYARISGDIRVLWYQNELTLVNKMIPSSSSIFTLGKNMVSKGASSGMQNDTFIFSAPIIFIPKTGCKDLEYDTILF